MTKAIHLINEREGSTRKGLSKVADAKDSWRSCCWVLSDSDQEALLGGWLYLHYSKNKPASFAGRIIGFEQAKREGAATERGVAIVFSSQPRGTRTQVARCQPRNGMVERCDRGRSAPRTNLMPLRRNTSALVLGTAVLVGIAIGVAPAVTGNPATKSIARYADTISSCRVTDGDTIRCGSERIRLLAIDAPELPGHCRIDRDCVPGDPLASTESLRNAMTGNLTIDRVGKDRYRRTLAQVASNAGDLSCWQLEHGQAIYKSTWDNGLRVARTCPRAVLR